MNEFAYLSPILRRTEVDNKIFFECPGCGVVHGVTVGEGSDPRWDWNGNVNKPTFTPSILVRYTWGVERTPVVCHSFVTDGRIQFLADCTHELAGQTVDIPVWDTVA